MAGDGLPYGALADERRRFAVREMLKHETLTLPDLAECVAEAETGQSIQELSAEFVSQVYFSLYHTHVPKLEEAELVAYDQEGDLVTATEELAPKLSAIRSELKDMLEASPLSS